MVLDEVEIILGSNITYTKRIVNMVFLHIFYYTSTGFLFLLFYFFLQFWVYFIPVVTSLFHCSPFQESIYQMELFQILREASLMIK